MMLPLVVVGCTSKRNRQPREATIPPAWIMQPPRLADTAERGLFHPQREADHYAKTTEEPRSILMSSVDRVAHIDGHPHYCEYIRFQERMLVDNRAII